MQVRSTPLNNITCGCHYSVFMTSQGQFYYCGFDDYSRIHKSISRKKQKEYLFLLSQLQIPEIRVLYIQPSSNEEIPFKLHSGFFFDVALFPNPKVLKLVEEDIQDFEF